MNRLKLARLLLFFAKALPRRYSLRSEEVKRPPFFILNAGRSGSTLLNRILNEHPELGLPSEQYFLGPAVFKYHFYNYMIWRDLIQVIVGELWDERKHTWNLELRPILRNMIDLDARERSLQHVVDFLYRGIVDKTYWGDSTPLNTVYFKELYHLFPKAKYIFLFRDGRDVVTSYKSGGPNAFGELARVEESTSRWLLNARAMQWYSQRTSVLEIRYETLMNDTEVELNRICEFLGVGPMPDNWVDYKSRIPNAEFFKPSHHDSIHRAPFTSSIGKWESILTKEEVEYCEKVMGSQLKKYGYV